MKSITKRLCLSMVILLCVQPVRAGGDPNEDGRTSLSDLTCLINWLLNPDQANGHAYVDLGLPSGTLWATQNIGAGSPQDPGYFFAWGETQGKINYTWQTYQWATADTTMTRYAQPRDVLAAYDDAASCHWGGLWREPTFDQWQELQTYCRWSWALVNGQYGYRVTANGTGIFLPAGGYLSNDTHYEYNLSGFYWTRETTSVDSLMAYGLYLDKSNHLWGYRYRYTGRNVRATLQPADLLCRYDVNGDGSVTVADRDSLIGILIRE